MVHFVIVLEKTRANRRMDGNKNLVDKEKQ